MADTPAAANLAIAPPANAIAETVGTVREYWRAIWSDTGGKVAVAFVVLLVALALLAPFITVYGPGQQLNLQTLKLQPPSWSHPFGTDDVSRDVMTRMLFGSRLSLRIAFLAAALSGTVGLLWGATAGYIGGKVDALLMRFVDMSLSIPRVLLVLTVLSLWPGPSIEKLVLVLGFTGWFGVSRLARAQALGIRNHEFVAASRALGASQLRVLVRHVVPHALGPVLVATTVGVGHALVLEAGLTYLGIGIAPPTPTWGNIVADGKTQLQTWWLTVFPGIALIGTSLAVNAIAHRLRVVIHPRQLPGR